jgi:hydrogenase expression/formation protein HypD
VVARFFEPTVNIWRGLGPIPNSGLKIRKEYQTFDAEMHFDLQVTPVPEPDGCICGEVLRGLKKPDQCRLFAGICTPANPIGACMVSGEGACQAYYNYR